MKNYTSQVYEIIKELVEKYDEKAQVKYLCGLAEVSRSGYYNYFNEKSIQNRNKKEIQDEKDREVILDAFTRHGYKKGAKGIKMTLENEDKIVFNLKHIIRIMKKYDIICPIRKAEPYKQMLKKDLEHRTIENKLNREFKQEKPGKVLLTDITYLSYGYYKRAYLSTIKDASTNEIMTYRLSTNLYLDFILDTMWDVVKQKEVPIPEDAFVHSDQGSHYTSPTFQSLLKELKLGQSMSRKGNCWDNAPQESFFGHMKDEVDFKAYSKFEELQVEIDRYIEYYNNYRYQWNLKKMSLVQYRNHLLQTNNQ